MSLLLGYTPSESLDDAWAAEAQWETYKDKHEIRVANCPPRGDHSYSKIRERFIFKEYPNRWSTANEFRHTLDLKKVAIKLGISDDLTDFLENDIDVVDPKLDNNQLMQNINDMYTKVFSYKDAHSTRILQSFAKSLLRFCAPLNNPGEYDTWVCVDTKTTQD
jgi:hypothetical protein